MAKVEIEVYQRKHGEHSMNIPDEVIEKGDKAIKDYIWRNSGVETALDYGTGDTELNYLVTQNED